MLLPFVAVAVVMTFVGGSVHLGENLLSRARLNRLFALRAGILLSVSLTEVLPEAWGHGPAFAAAGALSAFALLFVMERLAIADACPEYLEDFHIHHLGWAAFFALSAHSFIDGLNLSLSFAAGARAGIAVGLALALHKIADGFTLTSLFRQAGYGRSKSLGLLCAVAAATPLGSYLSFRGFGGLPPAAEAALLGFAAGSFVYIAAGDVLAHLYRRRDAWGLACFALGTAAMAALRFL